VRLRLGNNCELLFSALVFFYKIQLFHYVEVLYSPDLFFAMIGSNLL
jgi:hypothetical protein